MGTIIVGAIVLVIIGAAVFYTIRSRKKGGSCGCGGGCSGCSGCSGGQQSDSETKGCH